MESKSALEIIRKVVSSRIQDPRVVGRTRHLLFDIIVIVLCGVIAGCDGWKAIEEHARDREDWFSKFLALPGGIPSHHTLERVFECLWPDEFQVLLGEIAYELYETFSGTTISIDGKTLKGSYDSGLGLKSLHVVSAYCGGCGVTLAQVATDVKSNEITAIPKLLDLIEIEGATVTLDAMGCQTKIVEKIVDKGADYVISLKGNQGTLHKQVTDYFSDTTLEELQELQHVSVLTTIEKEHGRIDERSYVIVEDVGWIEGRSDWKKLTSIGMVISRRTIGEKVSEERRHFISSIAGDVEHFEKSVRGHWSIENELHHVLDVSFNEDHSRIRRDHSPENMAAVRRLANSILRADKENVKLSVKGRMRKAMRRPDYIETLLGTVSEEQL